MRDSFAATQRGLDRPGFQYQNRKISGPEGLYTSIHAMGTCSRAWGRQTVLYVRFLGGWHHHTFTCMRWCYRGCAHPKRGMSLSYEGPLNIIWVILVVVDRCKAHMQCSGLTWPVEGRLMLTFPCDTSRPDVGHKSKRRHDHTCSI
jgi:hypothetical protein